MLTFYDTTVKAVPLTLRLIHSDSLARWLAGQGRSCRRRRRRRRYDGVSGRTFADQATSVFKFPPLSGRRWRACLGIGLTIVSRHYDRLSILGTVTHKIAKWFSVGDICESARSANHQSWCESNYTCDRFRTLALRTTDKYERKPTLACSI